MTDHGPGVRATFIHQPVMGTVVEVRLHGDEASLDAADAAIMAEIDRCLSIFDVFDATSELSRWRAGDEMVLGAELSWLLEAALLWSERSLGAFHPATAPMAAMWRDAQATGVEPDTAALAGAVEASAGEAAVMEAARAEAPWARLRAWMAIRSW